MNVTNRFKSAGLAITASSLIVGGLWFGTRGSARADDLRSVDDYNMYLGRDMTGEDANTFASEARYYGDFRHLDALEEYLHEHKNIEIPGLTKEDFTSWHRQAALVEGLRALKIYREGLGHLGTVAYIEKMSAKAGNSLGLTERDFAEMETDELTLAKQWARSSDRYEQQQAAEALWSKAYTSTELGLTSAESERLKNQTW